MKYWMPIALFMVLIAPLMIWQLGKQSLTTSTPSSLISEQHLLWLSDLYRLIEIENTELKADWKKAYAMQGDRVKQKQNATWLLNKMHRYGLWKNGSPSKINESSLTELLKRMAPVPPSIVLAHAIVSSDWGRTQQSRVANNLFNVRCYAPQCGMLDEQLEAHSQWRIFQHRSAAIRWLIEKELTTEPYSQFRNRRLTMLARGAEMPGQWYRASLPAYIAETIERYQLHYWDRTNTKQ